MHFKLYYSSTVKPSDSTANEGFGEVLELLEKVERKGVTCERVDTSKLTDEETFNAYTRSVIGPTQLKKYKVRQVFGSTRRSGWLFGKGVPSLVVYSSRGSEVPDMFFRMLLVVILSQSENILKRRHDDRKAQEPKVCPKCNSPYCNKPKWKGVKK